MVSGEVVGEDRAGWRPVLETTPVSPKNASTIALRLIA
jgi:hypothetical protein